MRKNVTVILAIFHVLLLTSCLTTKQTNLLREPGGDIPYYPKENMIGEYTIKSGDELQVSVIVSPLDKKTSQLFSLYSPVYTNNDENLSIRSLTVSPDGNINFPYLGEVYVKGKTTLEVRQILEKKMNEEISDDCLIEVYLNNRFFSVIGESTVGRYPIAKEKTTIFQALSQSKDIRPYGDRSKIKIIRQTDDGTIVKTFDIRSKDVINSDFYYIQPNDVIYVQPLGREFWGVSSFGALFAIVTTVASLGVTVGWAIYSIIK